MVIAMKEINSGTPDMHYLFRFCSVLYDNGELEKSRLCAVTYLDPFWADKFAKFLADVGFITVNGVTYLLTDRGKVFVEKMAEVYKFILSEND